MLLRFKLCNNYKNNIYLLEHKFNIQKMRYYPIIRVLIIGCDFCNWD